MYWESAILGCRGRRSESETCLGNSVRPWFKIPDTDRLEEQVSVYEVTRFKNDRTTGASEFRTNHTLGHSQKETRMTDKGDKNTLRGQTIILMKFELEKKNLS